MACVDHFPGLLGASTLYQARGKAAWQTAGGRSSSAAATSMRAATRRTSAVGLGFTCGALP